MGHRRITDYFCSSVSQKFSSNDNFSDETLPHEPKKPVQIKMAHHSDQKSSNPTESSIEIVKRDIPDSPHYKKIKISCETIEIAQSQEWIKPSSCEVPKEILDDCCIEDVSHTKVPSKLVTSKITTITIPDDTHHKIITLNALEASSKLILDLCGDQIYTEPIIPHPFFLPSLKTCKKSTNFREKRINHTHKSLAPLFPTIKQELLMERCPTNFRQFIRITKFANPWEPMSSCQHMHSSIPDEISHVLHKLDHSILYAPNTKFNQTRFDNILRKILKKIGVQHDSDTNDENYKNYIYRNKIFLTGSTGCGKSTIPHAIVKFLDLKEAPIEIDGAVGGSRTGRPFDNLLTKKRHDVSHFTAPKARINSSAVNIGFSSSQIHMREPFFDSVVLIDDVDIVFPVDRFYPSLESFLLNVPQTTIVVMTSNSDAKIISELVNFPRDIIRINFDDEQDDTHAYQDINHHPLPHKHTFLMKNHSTPNGSSDKVDLKNGAVAFEWNLLASDLVTCWDARINWSVSDYPTEESRAENPTSSSPFDILPADYIENYTNLIVSAYHETKSPSYFDGIDILSRRSKLSLQVSSTLLKNWVWNCETLYYWSQMEECVRSGAHFPTRYRRSSRIISAGTGKIGTYLPNCPHPHFPIP